MLFIHCKPFNISKCLDSLSYTYFINIHIKTHNYLYRVHVSMPLSYFDSFCMVGGKEKRFFLIYIFQCLSLWWHLEFLNILLKIHIFQCLRLWLHFELILYNCRFQKFPMTYCSGAIGVFMIKNNENHVNMSIF